MPRDKSGERRNAKGKGSGILGGTCMYLLVEAG